MTDTDRAEPGLAGFLMTDMMGQTDKIGISVVEVGGMVFFLGY